MYVYYLNVPLNEKGIREFETYDEIGANVKTFELTEEEFTSLFRRGKLFDILDKKYDTIIDRCEEERIEFKDLADAVLTVEQYLQKVKDPIEKSATKKVLESLKLALDSNTFWEIDVYTKI